ncbi:hypothetical protein HSBAA_40920 [Vreelandella sulfidaeris]|uniref:Polysaccharide biosynthesis protein C-terminal domain-containing protein n=1 Tax=Vreelandella sulfidaeris TaxID=115553 RepID=A0A455U9C1_9GAMM|nr:hypothetical protein HSBAA_40920 [Halomonas sulfidaeris]
MLPLSLSMALTVRVGNTLGQQRLTLARQVAWNGIVISVIVAVINSIFLWFSAVPVIALYTSNSEIQALALSIIALAVIFQLSDSLQVNLAGALRGYKDTRIVMVITVLSYWVVGLGAGTGWAREGRWHGRPSRGSRLLDRFDCGLKHGCTATSLALTAHQYSG